MDFVMIDFLLLLSFIATLLLFPISILLHIYWNVPINNRQKIFINVTNFPGDFDVSTQRIKAAETKQQIFIKYDFLSRPYLSLDDVKGCHESIRIL